MKAVSLLFILFLMIISLSCTSLSSVNMDYTYDPEADFASLRSYDWFPIPRKNIRYELIIKQIKSALKRQLAERGFNLVSEDPDFLIALHGGIQSRLDYDDWVYFHEQYGEYAVKRRLDVMKYTDDMLIFDFIDAKTKMLIYRATVTVFIIEPTPEERAKKINEAVMKVLDNYLQLNSF